MSFDYDIVFPCACCGEKSTNYLCGKCAKTHCPSCARLAAKMKDREGLAKAIYDLDPLYEFPYSRNIAKWETLVDNDKKESYKIADAVFRWMEE